MNSGKRSQPVSVDGKAGDNDIYQMFSDKYDKLYNSVSYDADLYQNIKEKCIINECVLKIIVLLM